MGRLSKPLVPDGPVRTFFERLHVLHAEAGRPSLRDLQRRTRGPTRPRGVNPTTIHDAFSAPRLARWDVIAVVVEQLGGNVDEFAALWRAARTASVDPTGEPDLPRSASGVPRELPLDVFGFTGRAEPLAELDRLVATASATVAVVSGTAGVGKTTLAVHWGHRATECFPDGQFYVDLRGHGPDRPLSPDEALAGLLRGLGCGDAEMPAALDERTSRYRTLIAGRRILLIIDNARTAEQVRPLLPGSASCFAIVTSRDNLSGLVVREGARRLALDLLSPGEAVQLLELLIGDRARDNVAATAELAERCARLPLALRVAAELAASRATTPLVDLITELTELSILDDGDDERTTVRTVFSWSYRHLSPDAARLFGLFGMQPCRYIDSRAAAAMVETDLAHARRLLDTLVHAHLLTWKAPDRYGTHQLLRAYARERVDPHAARAALIRLLAHHLATAESAGDAASHGWLEEQREDLVALVGLAVANGWTEYAVRIGRVLDPSHRTRGRRSWDGNAA